MGLRDIKGQDGPVSIIKGLIRKDRMPHALLFAGEDGVGKMLTALNLAKAMNCLAPLEYDACDRCPACTRIDRGIHPDVITLEPTGKGRQITVESIRGVEGSLSMRAFEGKWKVLIIREAERMSVSGANAFLKTLEEAPGSSIIVLITSRPEILPETILSRCHRINFSLLPRDTLCDMLIQRGVDEHTAGLMSILSGGSIGRIQGDDLLKRRQWSLSMLIDMLNMKESAWTDRQEMEEWFEWAVMWLRDLCVYILTGDVNLLVSPDKIKELSDHTPIRDVSHILKLARELYNIKKRLSLNPNTGLIYTYTGILLREGLGMSKI